MGRSGALSRLRIFVGNIPWTVNRHELKEYFSKFGQVTNAYVIFDKETGLSKNHGFITMKGKEEYDAILKEHSHFLEGNYMIARPMNKLKMEILSDS